MADSSQFPPGYMEADRSGPAYIGVIVITSISCVVVLVRLYARKFLIRELGWDDYFIVIAQLVAWVTMALCIMVLHYGSGRHLPALMAESPEKLVYMYKWLVPCQMVYMFNLYLCRVSGLAFYARINPMPQFILYLRLSFAFITAVWIAQSLVIALQCIPLEALWDQTVKGRCLGSAITFITTGVLTIVCDSLVLLLPIKIVLTLQANMTRKLALLGILCFGIFAVVTSVCRLISMINSVENETDATWYFSTILAWTCAEVSTAIIALSLPALRAIFGFLKDKKTTRDQSYSHGSESIGLESAVRRTNKGRIFNGSNIYENTVEVDVARSPSQEALWDGRQDQKIRITDTVEVDVQR